MKKGQAKGLLLEIMVAKLIECNGYVLITSSDGTDIKVKGDSIYVRGRGGYHQVDSLGKFRIHPPFMFPLRLFCEAKYYSKDSVGIDIVREGIGILQDVNSNYSTIEMKKEELQRERYHYNYAVFSATGFSPEAQLLALAHKIHLVDLQGVEFEKILELIEVLVDNLFGDKEDINKKYFREFKKQFTDFIMNYNHSSNISLLDDVLLQIIHELKEEINNKYMYMAAVNSSIMIPIYSNELFHSKLRDNPHREIRLTWELEGNLPVKWFLRLKDEQDIYAIFYLPKTFHEYLLKDIHKQTRILKNNMLNKFTIFLFFDDYPTICTLEFNNENIIDYYDNLNDDSLDDNESNNEDNSDNEEN